MHYPFPNPQTKGFQPLCKTHNAGSFSQRISVRRIHLGSGIMGPWGLGKGPVFTGGELVELREGSHTGSSHPDPPEVHEYWRPDHVLLWRLAVPAEGQEDPRV